MAAGASTGKTRRGTGGALPALSTIQPAAYSPMRGSVEAIQAPPDGGGITPFAQVARRPIFAIRLFRYEISARLESIRAFAPQGDGFPCLNSASQLHD